MTANAFDWDDELPPETEEEVYRALLRALRRKQGFGLFFVQCSTDQGEKIVADLRRDLPQPSIPGLPQQNIRDLPQQNIQELHLQGEVVTLYDQIAALWQQQPFEVLVIEGLQASLYAYEDTKRFSGWSSDDIYNYSWKGVPKILNHLNQQREHLRNDFPARFVFLVPPFVVDYFIQRAADFIDWRSGLFRFPRDPEEVAQDANRFAGGGYEEYLTLSPQARVEKILELKSLQEVCLDAESKAELLFQLGLLFVAEQDYGNGVISYDKAIEIKPDNHQACHNRGYALNRLGRNEEAIASYDKAVISFDKAIEIKPDNHQAWYSRGDALDRLGRNEEAIASYDKAIEIKPDKHQAWCNRGNALNALGQNEEAITSHDRAIEIKPDYHRSWGGRGIALMQLEQFQAAHESFDRAILFKPDDAPARYNKACCYGLQEQIDRAIETLQHAIVLDSKFREFAKTDSDFDRIRQDDRFQALLEA